MTQMNHNCINSNKQHEVKSLQHQNWAHRLNYGLVYGKKINKA